MKVLLAIDGSEESIEAATLLGHLPFQEKPVVSVLAVLDDYPAVEVPVDWSETDEKDAAKDFESVASFLKESSRELSFIMKRGHASQVILQAAKELDADLIVMGARGHSAIYRVVLGSTANYVANHAQCSVLIVRPNFEQDCSADNFRVMLAYDGSSCSRVASAQMFDMKWPTATTDIHIAMMLLRPKLAAEDRPTFDSTAVEEAHQTLQTESLSESKSCDCPTTFTVRETLHVGNALWELAESKRTNLIFVGPSGKSSLTRFFLGSTTRYLLNHASSSLWIARVKEWDKLPTHA